MNENQTEEFAPSDTLRRLAEAQNWRCAYCGVQVNVIYGRNNPKKATRDHVVPKRKGGSNHYENMVMSCAGCNFAKDDFEANDFKMIRFALIQRGIWLPGTFLRAKHIAALNIFWKEKYNNAMNENVVKIKMLYEKIDGMIENNS